MMFYPLSGYKIDGYDLYGTWGITVRKIDGLLKFYERKGELYHSWPDEDGEEAFVNSNDIHFHGRDITMFCYLRSQVAPHYNNFANLLRQFKGQLEKPQMHVLTVPYITTTYSLMYVKGSDVTMRTPRLRTSLVVGEFSIQFRETSPERS